MARDWESPASDVLGSLNTETFNTASVPLQRYFKVRTEWLSKEVVGGRTD